jgi:DNA-binding response OmpR family regulator
MNNKVLICDDDEGILEVTALVLREKGYNVISLQNSNRIFEVIEKEKPKVILLDLWMPGLRGEDITIALKKRSGHAPVPSIIIISAKKDVEKTVARIGADDYLTKPFDIYDLESIIDKHMRKGSELSSA